MSGPFDRAGLLLYIVEKSNPNQWPRLKALHDAAMAELEELAEEADKENKARAAEAVGKKAHEEAFAKAKSEAFAKSESRPVIPMTDPPERREI